MITTVKKWGNSLGLRIPKSFAQEALINDGATVNLKIVARQIIIKSIKKSTGLKEMLSQITQDNIHSEIKTSYRRGKEIW